MDVARQDIWGLLQAAAKPELRRVFAAAHLRPCWLDTGRRSFPDAQQHCIDCIGKREGNGSTIHCISCNGHYTSRGLMGCPGVLMLAGALNYLSLLGYVTSSWACQRIYIAEGVR